MDIAPKAARPPYVEFKRVAVHDKDGSIAAGYRRTKDVDMVHIMQPGGRDVYEKEAVAWLASIRNKMLSGAHDAFPQEWIDGFDRMYDAWKRGLEAPLNGTSVREWSYLSPAQAENLIAIRVQTIEDVANMTEEAMGRFGMGGRDLREKARQWVQGREIADATMKENVELRRQLSELNARISAMESPDGAPSGDEIDALRKTYVEKFGKPPHHRKNADTLRQEIGAS